MRTLGPPTCSCEARCLGTDSVLAVRGAHDRAQTALRSAGLVRFVSEKAVWSGWCCP
jgi:hypothetical protein